jgi:hypothetical protein
MIKTWIAVIVVVALSFGMAACEKKTASDTTKSAGKAVNDAAKATGKAVGNAAEATGKAVGNAAETTGKAVGNAAQATGEYLSEKKDEAVKAAQEKIVYLDTKWQELQDKAAPATDEAKAEFQKAKDQMAKTLAKDAGADAWQKSVKPALDSTLDAAEKFYENMAAKFGSK